MPLKCDNIHRGLIALLIDFDQDKHRLSYVKLQIPDDLEKRVFVLGVLSEPESLKRDIKKDFERSEKLLQKIAPITRMNCGETIFSDIIKLS